MNTYGEVEVGVRAFFASALHVGGQRHPTPPAPLSLGGRAPGTHRTGNLVGLTASLDFVKRNIYILMGTEPVSLLVQPVTQTLC
jgi:hypothetical protein